jgi:hypothetical protein
MWALAAGGTPFVNAIGQQRHYVEIPIGGFAFAVTQRLMVSAGSNPLSNRVLV